MKIRIEQLNSGEDLGQKVGQDLVNVTHLGVNHEPFQGLLSVSQSDLLPVSQSDLEQPPFHGLEPDLEEDLPITQIIKKPVQVPIVENRMSLGERDNYSSQIEQQIQAKREMLLEKQKTLKRRIQENEYLEGVNNDYNKYYNYIRKQKEDQIKQMELLNQYLNDIIVNGKLTDEDIAQSKKEQDEILNSISEIKSELDKIVSS